MTRLTESEAEDAVLEWRDGIRWSVACGPGTALDTPRTERAHYGEGESGG